MSDPGNPRIWAVLGVVFLASMSAVVMAARCIHQRSNKQLLERIKREDKEFGRRLEEMNEPSIFAAMELVSLGYRNDHDKVQKIWRMVALHTAPGRNFLASTVRILEAFE